MLSITSPIATERLLLRPFTADDLDDLYAIQSRPDVVRYLYWDVRSRDEVRDVLQRKSEQTVLAEGDGLSLAVTVPGAEGTVTGVIGEVVLWWRSAEHRQAVLVPGKGAQADGDRGSVPTTGLQAWLRRT